MTRREFIGAGLVATAATALQGEVTATVPGGAGMVSGVIGLSIGESLAMSSSSSPQDTKVAHGAMTIRA